MKHRYNNVKNNFGYLIKSGQLCFSLVEICEAAIDQYLLLIKNLSTVEDKYNVGA